MSSFTYHYTPGQDDKLASNNPQQPAAPLMHQHSKGSMDSLTIVTAKPESAEVASPDLGNLIDPNGDPRGPRLGHIGRPEATFNTADLAGQNTTSFLDDRNQPCPPNRATRVRLGDGQVTSVQAAVHLGIVALGNDGPQIVQGRVFRDGQIFDGRAAQAVLAKEGIENLARSAAEEMDALNEAYGQGNWTPDLLSPQSRAVLSRLAQSQGFAPQGQPGIDRPAMTPMSPEQFARQQAQQARARTQQIPDVVNARDEELDQQERTLSDRVDHGSLNAFRRSLATAIATGDDQAILAAQAQLVTESGISAERAAALAGIVGRQIGRPVAQVAQKLGVDPQALMAGLQRGDPVAYSQAVNALATQRNAAPFLKLVQRAMQAVRGGKR